MVQIGNVLPISWNKNNNQH